MACKGTDQYVYTVRYGYRVWKCRGCKGLSLYPVPWPEEARAIYSKDYFTGAKEGYGYVDYDRDKEAMRSTFENYLVDLEPFAKGRRLLDVGTATGYFLQVAQGKGWKAQGVEVSRYAVEQGKSKGLDILRGNVGDIAGQFDVITMWDVIEHLPDPMGNLNKAWQLLGERGILAITTPDTDSLMAKVARGKWYQIGPPEHIHLFSGKGLRLLLESSGFEIIASRHTGKRFTIGYIAHILTSRAGKGLKVWDCIGRIEIGANTRDNMYVVARKVDRSKGIC
jgi:SAM-dependent methyltransferase